MFKIKFSIISDLLINVLFPIIVGTLIYTTLKTPAFILVRNYLPDGLWAYALVSCVLIIWERNVNKYWIGLALFAFVAFEALQYLKFINGTADLLDILVYFFFAALAIKSNYFFFLLKKTRP